MSWPDFLVAAAQLLLHRRRSPSGITWASASRESRMNRCATCSNGRKSSPPLPSMMINRTWGSTPRR